MSPWTRPDMVELTFEVPDRLVGEVYLAIGLVLRNAREESETPGTEPDLHDWGTESFDTEAVDLAWRKFSPRAQAVFSLLMENPGVAMTADEIAAKIGLANGRHALAGVVAWPSRQCAEMRLNPPFRFDTPTAPGETGSYWMDPETARLFIGARDRAQASQAEVRPKNPEK
ncbi:MAG TPA: DUF6416 domain-containing protein [Streptosporangiaceae bacterium]|nr:DUF6416 domain-containing protein [Streptosporangiaceae bacterium]